MTQFTPVAGLLIGASAVLLLGALGRIAGVSGIAFGALALLLDRLRGRDTANPAPAADTVTAPARSELAWRIAFLVGLLAGARLWAALSGEPSATARTGMPAALLIVGGLLVGAGTALAHGCTSGHGVCGLARLSPRSLVATGVFMAVAVATVFVMRHAG
ncbi:YeeE/YedE family protein [Derxia gummosa]|uniref:YeeE/YedE family protein n=1 Tax=Derxia gummosa DSM 723 TaxID=1121388 RepID=A0A8B6X407_9BURK|nr:YeeE/YedE thiosulfate transporter family protein [Derxia gummosa]